MTSTQYNCKQLPVGSLNDLINQRNKLLNDAFGAYNIYDLARVSTIGNICNISSDDVMDGEIIYESSTKRFYTKIDGMLNYTAKIIDNEQYNSTNSSEYNPIVDEDFSEECDEDLEVSKEYTEDFLPVIVDKNYKGFVIGTRYLRVAIGNRIAIYVYIPTEEQRKNLKNLSKPFPVIKEILSDGKEIVIDRCKMSEIIKEEIEELLAKRGA